jgi:hypothetical protein
LDSLLSPPGAAASHSLHRMRIVISADQTKINSSLLPFLP